jgi:hypothetical protein
VVGEKCADFLATYLGTDSLHRLQQQLSHGTAALVSSLVETAGDRTRSAIYCYVRSLPHDTFRAMAQHKRSRVLPLYRPMPVYAMCILKRFKSAESASWAVYKLYEERSGTLRFLLSAARDLHTGRLAVTADEHRSWAPAAVLSQQLVGCLGSNALDTLFTLYDNGLECGGLAAVNAKLPGVRRREIGVVAYPNVC